MLIKNKKILISIILLSVILVANCALAAVDPYAQLNSVASGVGLSSNANLPGTIGNIVKGLLTLIGVLFLVLLIYAGFLWMTDMGDGKKAQKAREIIKNSVIGLILVFISYGITLFVVNQLIAAAK